MAVAPERAGSIWRGRPAFLPQPPLNSIHPALRLTSPQRLPLPGRPGSAPLFELSPLEVPPRPPHWLQDGAGQERSRHVNFPLFFRAPKTDRLPSNFCGTTCEGAHYVKHALSSLRKLRGAFRRLHVLWEYYLRRKPLFISSYIAAAWSGSKDR
ncbi:unnamed protein product [Coccothraustes coccothraustes]